MTGPRVLVLDIETSPNLGWVWALWKQDIALNQIEMLGEVICFAAQWYGEKDIIFASTFHDGKGIMLDVIWELLDEADIVVHWNGNSFDMPHLNREFILTGRTPPSPYKNVDLLLVARKQFNFASNKLDFVAQQLGVGKKVKHEGFPLWLACIAGDEKAWARMRKYNIGDVRITGKVYTKLMPWITPHPHAGLYGADPDKCGRCSGKLQRRGYATTMLGKYQRYACTKCGGWSRGGKRVEGVDIRPTP